MDEAQGTVVERVVMVGGKAVPTLTPVRDTVRNKTGLLRGEFMGSLWLLPPGGGIEWPADPGTVELEEETA